MLMYRTECVILNIIQDYLFNPLHMRKKLFKEVVRHTVSIYGKNTVYTVLLPKFDVFRKVSTTVALQCSTLFHADQHVRQNKSSI